MCTRKNILIFKENKTYLRNTMGQSRLNSLCVISIGRDLINSYTGYNEEVMNLFINKKEKRMLFIIKVKNKHLNFS